MSNKLYLLIALIYSILPLFIRPTYRTNDDVAISMWSKGVGLSPFPSDFTIFNHPYYSLFLKNLFLQFPDCNWHFWIVYVTTCLSICHLLLREKPHFWSRLFFSLGIIIWCGLNFNFTTSTILIVGASLLSFRQDSKNIFSLFLYFVGFCIRPQAGLMVLCLFLARELILYFVNIKDKKNINFMSMFNVTAVTVLLFFMQSQYIIKNNWKDFFEFNSLRANINDFQQVTPSVDLLKKAHLTENDFKMLADWNFADEKKFNLKTLKILNEKKNLLTKDRLRLFRQELKQYESKFYLRFFISILLISLLFFATLGDFVLTVGLVALSSLLITYYFKMPPRFADAFLIFPALAAFSSQTKYQFNGFKKRICLLAPLLFLLTTSVAFKQNSRFVKTQRALFEQRLSAYRPYRDHLFVLWGGSLNIVFLSPLDSLNEFKNIFLYGLGVTSQSPFNEGWKKKFNFSDIYVATVTRDDILIFANKEQIKILTTYYLENYSLNVASEEIEHGLFRLKRM